MGKIIVGSFVLTISPTTLYNVVKSNLKRGEWLLWQSIKNQGTVNVDAVTNSILSNGGGINKGNNEDGSTHISVYSRTENRHISYDKDKDGNISGVHSSNNGYPYMDYKGGK